MASIIVYGSCYGTSRQYAETLSKETGIRCLSFTRNENLTSYDRVIYIGGLYMGNVLGLTRTAHRLSERQHLTVFTVGLSDTQNEQTAERVRTAVEKQLPAQLQAKAEIYHLPGCLDYARLSFTHRAIIDMMVLKLRRLPETERGENADMLMNIGRSRIDLAGAVMLNAARLGRAATSA